MELVCGVGLPFMPKERLIADGNLAIVDFGASYLLGEMIHVSN
ncbi:hypothetical protein KCTCHS21_31050 [Cohnella abietis]|uniref:Uncharacterized protein n=1 Tax=Cohnella abietis TaxID=2507935 RepID=A0A3T1D6J9_9BACL|nr:hypothetical protein KCTCHS21_31050 [Cohnella abietis]